MPRRPTPRALRVVRSDGEQAIVPDAPRGLRPKSVEAWKALWSSPIGQILLPDLDGNTIETLLRLREERDTEFQMGRKRRIVLGSQGQPVINPVLTNAIAIQKEIRALEDSLGLNPNARLKLGILLGDANRSIGDMNAEFEQDEFSDVDLDDDDGHDAPEASRRSG